MTVILGSMKIRKRNNVLDGTSWETFRSGWWALHLAAIPAVYFLGKRIARRRSY